MLELLAAVLKALLYASFLTVSGVVVAAATLQVPKTYDAFVARIVRTSSLFAIPTALLIVMVLVLRLGEFDRTTIATVFSSSVGAAFFMQFAAIAFLLAFTEDESARGLRLLASALATGSIAFNGHAASIGPFEGFFVFVHVSAAAWWIGSLFLLRESCKRADEQETARILRRFSVFATRVVGALAVAGFLLVYVLVRFETLPSLSDYEINLAIKLAIVIVLFVLASYNKFRLTPKILALELSTIRTLKRMVNLEIAVIVLVLTATAILTTYTSPT